MGIEYSALKNHAAIIRHFARFPVKIFNMNFTVALKINNENQEKT